MLAVIALVGFAEWPLLTATLWHMRNGNTVELEGHSFHVPPLYQPEVSEDATDDLAAGGSLICRAVGTRLAVATWASPAQIQETRLMLETSD